MSQCDMIMQHLKDHGTITPREALADYGIMRLGARIYDLKKSGIRITRQTKIIMKRILRSTLKEKHSLFAEWAEAVRSMSAILLSSAFCIAAEFSVKRS